MRVMYFLSPERQREPKAHDCVSTLAEGDLPGRNVLDSFRVATNPFSSSLLVAKIEERLACLREVPVDLVIISRVFQN